MPQAKKSDDKQESTAPAKKAPDKEETPDMSPSVADPPGPITPEHESGTPDTREEEQKAREPQES